MEFSYFKKERNKYIIYGFKLHVVRGQLKLSYWVAYYEVTSSNFYKAASLVSAMIETLRTKIIFFQFKIIYAGKKLLRNKSKYFRFTK